MTSPQELRHEMGPWIHDVVHSSTGCLDVLYVSYAKGQPRSPPWLCIITETCSAICASGVWRPQDHGDGIHLHLGSLP